MATDEETILAHVLVSGRVQGVFFRASAEEVARSGGLAGWVRNLADGRVEAVFEGPRGAVEEAIRWCHEGPPAAQVSDVEVRWEAPEGLDDFDKRPNA